MNFNIKDGIVNDLDEIYEGFVMDYIFSTELKNGEIRQKYRLSYSEFKELADRAKAQYGLKRRPIRIPEAKYYYAHKGGFMIQKTIECVGKYIGFVPTEELAIEAVEKCKEASWNVSLCRKIVREMSEAHV